MSKFDKQYLKLCAKILKEGTRVSNRTGTDTIKLPYASLEFDLEEEFPILTTKKVGWKSAIIEMLWIYQAQSNDVRWLQDRGVKIWNEWQADEKGDYMGKSYSKEMAHTIGTAYGYIVDRFKLTQNLIETIKNNPNDRRMIMSLWQNDFIPTATLPSCVWSTEWDVTDGKINMVVHQRSCDVPLGLPFNVTQYATLLSMVAHCTGYKPGKIYYTIKDAHIYVNQVEGIKSQLKTYKKEGDFPAPKLWLNPEVTDFFKFDNSRELKDIRLDEYQHHKAIPMQVSI